MADPHLPYIDVYLAIPEVRLSGATYQINSKEGDTRGSFRFTAEARPTVDATIGTDEKVIQVARKSLRLLFDDENLEGFTTCRVARIKRSTGGTFELAKTFVPPLLDLAASQYLLTQTRRLIEIMTAKVASRSLSTRPKTRDLSDFTPSEAADFWYLHTLNTYLPEINHVWKVSRGHPERLFRCLLRLAGGLTTFAISESVSDLPEYDHNALGESFTALIERIIRLLNVDRKENCIVTPLHPVRQFVWNGMLNDDRLLDPAQMILSVESAGPAAALIANVLEFAKVSAPDDLNRLMHIQLSGLTLDHMAAPPPTVRLSTASQYFSITTAGALWENIRRSRSISVFLPEIVKNPKLELLTMIR